MITLTFFSFLLCCCHGYNWSSINLPVSHIAPFFMNNQNVRYQCEQDEQCPYRTLLEKKRCWGYETNCSFDNRLFSPNCPDDSEGWTLTKEEQVNYFWKSADFGYVQERIKEMKTLCEPKYPGDSSLKCSRYARYCRARNVYLDLRSARFTENDNFKEDFLLENEIGGHCKLHKVRLKAEYEHKSALQSWFAEIEHFSSLKFKPNSNENCDVIIDKPVMFMKLNVGDNMFHHFCGFINLYISLHINNSFSRDIYMINWDTSGQGYLDVFGEIFNAFTEHKIIQLKEFNLKRVCIKDAVFPLLPRMIRGMYFNMVVIPGCYGSSLFKAFSAHLVHRLHIPQEGPLKEKVRITFLARNTTYRKITNQERLVSVLKTVKEYDVRFVRYEFREMPFLEQVKISHNSDVFIGMHGAGLTHMIFLPDWASVFELFNCGDLCYGDLARLRGVKYFTWVKVEKMIKQDEGPHLELGGLKKLNYAFDETEFMRIVTMAAEHVKTHPAFIEARKLKDSASGEFYKDEF